MVDGEGARTDEWRRELAERVREVIEAGPDGPPEVFDTLALLGVA